MPLVLLLGGQTRCMLWHPNRKGWGHLLPRALTGPNERCGVTQEITNNMKLNKLALVATIGALFATVALVGCSKEETTTDGAATTGTATTGTAAPEGGAAQNSPTESGK